MPGMNGIDATAQIKAARPATTVVAWTSSDDASIRAGFAAAGAAAHLAKTDLVGLREVLRALGAGA